MKFSRLSDVRMGGADVVFRESPWNKAMGVVWCLVLTAIMTFVAIHQHSIFFGIVAAAMILLTLLFTSIFVKTFRAANWLMRITPREEVIIKYRSLGNAHFPAEDLVAFMLERDEIQWARKLVRTSMAPTLNNTGAQKQTTTYLELGVNERLTEELEEQLAAEQARPAPSHRVKSLDYPVTAPEPGVIQIRWRGESSWISPSVRHAIARLPKHVEVRESRETMTEASK